MTEEDDAYESIKRNIVTLTKTGLNNHTQVHLVAYDTDSKKLFERAKKQFDDMVKE